MAIKITEIFVSLGLSSASFTKGMNDMKNLAFGSAKEIGRSFKIIGVAAAGASAAAAAGLAALVRHQINVADQLSKMSQRTGVAVETLSGLSHAAELSDLSLQSLALGLAKLAKKGVDVFDLSEKLRAMPEGPQKTALALEVMEKAGLRTQQAMEFIPFLNTDLRAAQQEAERLGLVIDTKTAVAAEQFNDNLTRLRGVLVGVANQIMTDNIGSLNLLTTWFLNLGGAADKAGEEITAGFLNKFIITVFAARGVFEDFLSMLGESTGMGEPVTDPSGLGLEARIQQAVQQIQILQKEMSDLAPPSRQMGREFDVLGTKTDALTKRNKLLAESTEKLGDFFREVRKKSQEWLRELQKQADAPQVGGGLPAWFPSREEQQQTEEWLSRLPGAISQQVPPLKQINVQWEEMKKSLQGITFDALSGLGRQVAGLGTTWKNFFRQVLGDLAQMIWQLLVVKPLMDLIFDRSGSGGGGGGGGFSFGGLLSSIFGGLGGLFGGGGIGQAGPTPPFVPGTRAAGGPVWAGGVFTVGERGPERLTMFPGGGGVVTPLRGGAAGGGIVNQIDARGADAGVEFRVRRGIREGINEARKLALLDVRELALRRA